MTILALRNFSARKLRALSTALAVFFGVAMVAGTLMLTDSVNSSFDELFTEVNADIDVAVTPKVEVEGEFGEGEAFARAVPESVLADVQAVEGVEVAAGVIADETITIVDEDGDRIGPPQGGPPHIAVSGSDQTSEFAPFDFEEGSGVAPQADDEVAIDSITAEAEDYAVGDTIRVTGAAGESDYTISGVGVFGSGVSLGGASLVEFTLAEAQRITDKEGRFDEIDVRAADGRRAGRARAHASELAAGHRRGPHRRADGRRSGGRHQGGLQLPLDRAAGLRRRRGVRRRLPDLQHVLDHRRPALARVRDVAHARRLLAPGADRGADRGGARRPAWPRSSGSPAASASSP